MKYSSQNRWELVKKLAKMAEKRLYCSFGTPWPHQCVCQRTGNVYSAQYGRYVGSRLYLQPTRDAQQQVRPVLRDQLYTVIIELHHAGDDSNKQNLENSFFISVHSWSVWCYWEIRKLWARYSWSWSMVLLSLVVEISNPYSECASGACAVQIEKGSFLAVQFWPFLHVVFLPIVWVNPLCQGSPC